MRQFKTQKRVITSEEKIEMHEQAKIQTAKKKLTEAEYERLVSEGKMRKVISHPNPKTTIVHYEPIE